MLPAGRREPRLGTIDSLGDYILAATHLVPVIGPRASDSQARAISGRSIRADLLNVILYTMLGRHLFQSHHVLSVVLR